MNEAPLHSLRNILLKTLALFLLANLVFAFMTPLDAFGRLSAYNVLFPGRLRLPYGDDPTRSYNLSLFNLEAMFASHELAGQPKSPDEFRVIIIGDSSTWGYLLKNSETLAGQINAAQASLEDGRQVRAYNLGYPVMSLTKDLLVLSYALRYQPDLIIWPFTLESFPYDKQLFPPLLQNNSQAVTQLIEAYQLKVDPAGLAQGETGLIENTIIGARRALADLLRLQLYGVLWAATGIDQEIPDTFPAPISDLPADQSFHNLQPPRLLEGDIALDVLQAGISMAGRTPILLINEPMFISQGVNSDIRYNYYYPRWAYDDYRALLAGESLRQNWNYLDLWDAVPGSEFTNTAVHLSPAGSAMFAQHVLEAIRSIASHIAP
jgi:hypothetical protein